MGGPSLVQDAVRQRSNEELIETISKGRAEGGMPSFGGGMSQTEILILVGHIRTLQGMDSGPLMPAVSGENAERELPAEFVRGESLFFGKARCAECHAVLRRGGRTAPRLTNIEKRLDREQILTAIREPSASVKNNYKLWEVVTRDGETIRAWARTNMTPEGSVQLYNEEQTLWTTYFFEDLQSHRTLEESRMPAGLLDKLTEQEIEDLMIFLTSPKQVRP